MPKFKYISFDNGICRHLRTNNDALVEKEALESCANVQLGANVLGPDLKVVATCRRTWSEPSGWYFSEVQS